MVKKVHLNIFFIEYINEPDAFAVLLCIKLPQINGYVKHFNDNKCMNLLVSERELLKNIMKCGIVLLIYLKKGFDSEPVYNDKYIKTKIKIYNNRKIAKYQQKKKAKNNEYCTCLTLILLHSVIKTDNNYYPQMFLEESKYAVKKKKVMNTINEELDLDESDDESENDKSNESDEN